MSGRIWMCMWWLLQVQALSGECEKQCSYSVRTLEGTTTGRGVRLLVLFAEA